MKKLLISLSLLAITAETVFAGNPDRRGEAGAVELNMNGYARSAGLWNLNCAGIKGLEAERLNPAGLAYLRKVEIIAAYSSWLTGSGVNLIQAGIGYRIKSNAIALSVNSLSFGAIEKTTTLNPEGGLGTFKPTFLNIGLSYAKNFSLGTTKKMGANVITGGISLRLITEGIQNVNATGFGFDCGLQYTTGLKENVHFGVSLRNVGTPMRFKGDGFTYNGIAEANYNLSYDRKSNKFELPTQLNIGLAYDAYFGAKIETEPGKYKQNYRLTPTAQFTANAFGNDNYGAGLEFSLREIFMLRAAYRMESGIFKQATRVTAYNGFAAGLSFNVPFKKDGTGSSLGLDYGFRMTAGNTNFQHTHTVGIRFNLGGADKEQEYKEKSKSKKDDTAFEEEAPSKDSAKKKGKKGKVTVEDLEAKQAELDSVMKVAAALKVKAETPIYKIDTFEKKVTVIQIDTVLVPTVLEKSDYKAVDNIDTITKNGKTVLQFNDYEALEFETGSATIKTKSYQYLNYLVNMMKKNLSSKLNLSGHTDNVGDRDKNVKLSQDRVDAVKAYFVSKGISAERLGTQAFGPDKPKYKNDTEKGRAKNRRVEINIEL
jgi:outer membrane protein OmpA-like peptidoglycan-associated protein